VEDIIASEKADVQFALVCYRDYPPQDNTYITHVEPFTPSIQQMKTYVDKMQAVGGGDGPECMSTGLLDALELNYRPKSTKVCVLIADAPPHGLSGSGDGFPKGDPGRGDGKNYDPIVITNQMAQKGIILYSVACEPAVSGYNYLASFMYAISKKCSGKYCPLQSASLLSKVIIGGCREELNLSKITDDVLAMYNEEEVCIAFIVY
jgi:hypothetical protein